MACTFFCSGGIISLPPAVVASMTSNLALIGTRMGMLVGFVLFAVLIGRPITGVILGDKKDWLAYLTSFCRRFNGWRYHYFCRRIVTCVVGLTSPVAGCYT